MPSLLESIVSFASFRGLAKPLSDVRAPGTHRDLVQISLTRYDGVMGKRHRKQHAQQTATNARERVESSLARGDSRDAVEAAKILLRESPGAETEALVVRAYVARLRSLVSEGLGREAAAMAAIVRERFPAHVAAHAAELEDARLSAGDLDWLLRDLATADATRRDAIEARLVPWIADPAALARSKALGPDDPLAREAAAVAAVFEIVTWRLATADELARLGDVRRRSPLAPWKLLVRAIDAFHRHEDDRVAANVAAIEPRSPAARGGAILTELTGTRPRSHHSFAAERLIERISGGRETAAGHLRAIEAASRSDDRRRLRDEVRAFARMLDKLSPFAREQARIALLAVCGIHFGPGQLASLLRIDENGPEMPRYGALLMELAGAPFAPTLWIAYAQDALQLGRIEPWQAAEICLHALELGELDDPFVCDDPTHDHPDEEAQDTASAIQQIIGYDPAPTVFARLVPHLDRLNSKELRRVLTAWRKRDPNAPEPLVRLLRLAEKERKYDDALALVRKGEGLKILDPEYARLRQRVLFRKAEQLLEIGKRSAAAMLLDEIGNAGEDAGLWVLGLQWAAAPPAKAGELLAELSRRGVPGEVVVAEITGDLRMPFALPTSHPSPEDLLEGVRRAIAALNAAGRRIPLHSGWIVQRAEPHLDRATEGQLLAVGAAAFVLGLIPLAWKATARGLTVAGTSLQRALMLRAEILLGIHADPKRTLLVIKAARAIAEKVLDSEMVQRAEELAHEIPFFYRMREQILSRSEIDAIIEQERTSPEPAPRGPKKSRRKKAPAKPKKAAKAELEKGLFES